MTLKRIGSARKGVWGLSLLLALGLALPATLAIGAEPASAGQWKLTDTKSRKYFVPDDQLSKTTTRTKLRSDLAGSTMVERGRATRPVRERGNPKAVETGEEVAGSKGIEKKIEGRFYNTYEKWPVDTYRIITTTTPYTDYDVTEWEVARKDTYRVTYRVRDDVTWRDPQTGKRYTETVTYDETVNETQQGPWAAKSSRRQTGSGNEVSVDRSKVGSRIDSKRIKQVLAADGSAPTGVGSTGQVAGFAADAGKGSTTARSTAYSRALSLSGAERAKAKGGRGLDLAALFAAAGGQPDLLDEHGKAAWKLGADGNALVFTPYDAQGTLDPSGKVRLDPGQNSGRGAQGAEIFIANFSVKPLTLSGDFKRPGGGKRSGRLTAAN